MISFLQPLAVGNAIRCLLAPAEGTTLTRVLRKLSDDFTGPDDADAGIVFEDAGRSFVDVQALVNDTAYFYKAYDRVASAWVGSPSVSATPSATATLVTPDALDFIRARLAAGLKAEVAAGNLAHENNAIPVHTAPPLFDQIVFPAVTVHFKTDSPAYRGIGETLAPDLYDLADDEWIESEGWVSSLSFDVIGWAVGNPDVRNDLRKALKKVVIANLPVFASIGLGEIEFSQSDMEDMESYGAPVYQTLGTLSCKAPSAVADRTLTIHQVTVSALAA